jgi:signal transduction histidine kinase
MTYPILTTRISGATLVTIRDRTRQVAGLFGLSNLESTRFITAVSEIARNAVQFAGEGTVAFSYRDGGDSRFPPAVMALVSDNGPGIPDIESVLAGSSNGKGEVPLGILGTRRLVDAMTIKSARDEGTAVTIEMFLPRNTPRFTIRELGQRIDALIKQKPKTPVEELERQNREMLDTLHILQQKQQELTRADERKNQFLTMLAHELRTPLGTLHMSLDLLKRNPDIRPEELAQRRDVMARQTNQMMQLVEDMIDVSRVSQGKVEFTKVPIEINELLAQAVEMTGASVASREHQLTVNAYKEDIWIEGDVMRLKQALGNLIQNAARYTPMRGRIVVSIDRDDADVHIEITDNGIGISAEMLSQIFEMFVQGETTAVTSPGGLGIGLSLVRRLVEAHGGKVKALSEGIGKGCQFLVSLPLSLKHADEKPAH